jgi:hypothetical protein
MFSYYEIKKAQEKADPFDRAKSKPTEDHENCETDQNLELATREMTTQEQKKLATLMEGFEKEIHFIVIDIIAAMCRVDDPESTEDTGPRAWPHDPIGIQKDRAEQF